MRAEGTGMGHGQRLLQAPTPAEESLSLGSNSEGGAPVRSLFSHRAGWPWVRVRESAVTRSFGRVCGKRPVLIHRILIVHHICVYTPS